MGELKPCPNCRCDDVSTVHNEADANDTTPWSIECGMCEMTGPRWATEASAIDAWNALPRTEELQTDISFMIEMYIAQGDMLAKLARKYKLKEKTPAAPKVDE